MNHFVRATLVSIVGVGVAGAAILACSSATTSANSAGGDAAGGSDGQSSANEAGAGGETEGGPGGSDGSASSGAGSGAVLVSQSGNHFTVIADFKKSSASAAAGCVVTMVGPCIATDCPNVMGVPVASLNAGAITVTATGPASPVTLTFGTQSAGGLPGYPPATGQTSFYQAGDTVSASGAGGPDLPAFTAAIVSPNEIAVTSPTCTAGACTDLARSADTTVTWTGGGAGMVAVAYFTGSDNGTKTLSCSFAAAAGTGTVPSAALMKLDPGTAPNFSGHVLINPIDTTTIMVGSVPTLVGAQGSTFGGSFMTTD